jgi:Fic family protein
MGHYLETHPWLTFSVNLKKPLPELWMMLGECQSKSEHLSKVPLRPDIAEELHKMYMAKGVLATTAIEGNTLSEEEVQNIIDGKSDLPPSREYLGQEVSNIIGECNRILKAVAAQERIPLTVERIKEINRTVLENLELEEHVVPGEIRTYEVGVGTYKGAPWRDCEELLTKLCNWLNDETEFGEVNTPRAVVYAILKSIIAHLYLAWIHPFGDGNGRTARLIEFQILLSSGVPAPAAQLLSNHYYLTRNEYYRQLHYASKSGGDVIPFITYAVQGFVDGLKNQLKYVWAQVFDVIWNNVMIDVFRDRTGPSDRRRLELLQDISSEPKPVKLSELAMITPRVARHYASVTHKTLRRDVGKLMRMELLILSKGRVRANKELLQAFMPARAIQKLNEQAREKERAA